MIDIEAKLSSELGVEKWQVTAAVQLIDEDNTIPFIARYRKEKTGALNDEVLRKLYERLIYLRNLEDKKQQVIATIRDQGKMTDALLKQIEEAQTQVVVDDLYRPYRPKRRTRAMIAKEKGLEKLAVAVMAQNLGHPVEEEAADYVSEEKGVADVKEALEGASDILAESIADTAAYRMWIRQQFEKEGDLSRAREYAQIYRLVMDLLDQVYELLGEEEISRQEFADILEAGFGEITVGTIPQSVDRIVVGDMERTRLKQVKVLFFLGVNDGNIPKNASKGGIISDMDREFLIESGTEMAPSPRQQMYIQRLYLYLNMTKPSEQLYLSYAKVNSEGKGIRPSYLIDTVRKLFPAMSVEYPQNRSRLEQIEGRQEGARYLAEELREYADGTLREEERQDFYLMYRAYEADPEGRDRLTAAAFRRYKESGLSRIVARALYGRQLENSVSRLETYAACACRHFLQYGLSLQEREEFGFEVSDMGNVYHAVLENFAGKLAESNLTWWDFTEDFAAKAVKESVEAYAATYGETVLYSSARNEYAITRMSRILTRTVLTLQKHLKQGSFQPDDYELSFRFAEDLDSIHVDLSEDEKMHLQGRIDRIDVSEDAEHVYVKVIDYKSGNRKFDLAALYYGLQLVVYMNAAMEMESRKHPDKEIVPAALLYYHIDDPTIETPVELTDEQINEQILAKLRMNGVVNSDPEVVERLDRYMQDKSVVIPVEKKKDGSFSARSGVLSREEMQLISSYVDAKIRSIGREILDGKIAANPYEKGNEEACTYCAYKKVCGFDGSIPGYEKRQLEDLDKQALMQRMQKTVEA